MRGGRGGRRRHRGARALLLAAVVAATAGVAGPVEDAQNAPVKAAFVLNFVKFTVWPGLGPDAPIAICVVGDAPLVVALQDTVRDQISGGHRLEVRAAPDRGAWGSCQVLFVGDGAARPGAELAALRTQQVLTVGDTDGFTTAGIIELYVEDRRMRFAINVDAVGRSGLRLSSRLLTLARIVRDDRTQ